MLKKILCVAAILAVCAVTALSLGGCGRDLGDLTEPAPTDAADPAQPGAKETIVITIDANEFSALLSQIGGQIPAQPASPAQQPTVPVPATVAP